MEQKRCVVCDRLYDGKLRLCPYCFPDAQQEQTSVAEPQASPVPDPPKAPKAKRAWRSPLDGAVMHPSARARSIRSWTDRITLCIASFVVSLEVFSVLGFMLGITIGPATAAISALASVVAVGLSLRHLAGRWWRLLVIVAACALLFAGASALAGHFYDASYDGQAYQGAAVLRLAAGWNPLSDVEGVSLVGPHTIWHAHFPKGPWYEGAAIYRLLGDFEPAKGLTLLLAFAALAFCFGVFASYERMPLVVAGVLAWLAAFNPIAIAQTFTFYVDGRTSAWLTILIVALLDMALRADADVLVATIAGLAAAAALNIKFTATGYALILLLGGAMIIYLRVPRRQFWQAASIIGGASLIAILLVGWNPYVTNTLKHASPFYPVSGRGSFRLIAPSMMPADFAQGNRVTHLYRSLFGESADPYEDRRTQLKPPFTIQPAEWEQFNVADQRIGAFGPLFGGALLFALVTTTIVLATGGWRSSVVMITLAVVVVGWAIVLINPQAWIVRYSPHIWLMTILLMAIPFLYPSRVAARLLALLTCAVLVANLAFVGALSWKAQIHNTSEIQAQLGELARSKQPLAVYFELMQSNAIRLKAAGINYRVLGERPVDGEELYSSDSIVVRE